MFATATATPDMEDKLKSLLRNPFVSKGSINRPNIVLRVEEWTKSSDDPFKTFAKRVSEIINNEPCIIYTDFIQDVRPILSAIRDIDISAVGYYGEMENRLKSEAHSKWKNGQVQVIVATKEFGMGIDWADVRHIVRNGVPESITSWALELVRAGRDGMQATATILYNSEDVQNAKSWIKNHLHNPLVRDKTLTEFSNVWRYIYAESAGKCRRKVLLKLFGENEAEARSDVTCCDVCEQNVSCSLECKSELAKLLKALETLGGIGEVKLAEWLRGSNASLTNKYNKNCSSYGSENHHSNRWWRKFACACHVHGLVNRQYKSIIKQSGHYAIQGIYWPTTEGKTLLQEDGDLLLPGHSQLDSSTASENSSPGSSQNQSESVRKATKQAYRKGKSWFICST